MRSKHLELVDQTSSAETVYAEKYQWLLRWALHFCGGDHEMAEDLVQDTFVRMLSSWTTIRDAAHPERFLYSYLRYGFLRRRSLDQRASFQPLSTVDLEASISDVFAMDQGLVEWQREIHSVVDYLCWRKASAKSASMLLLRYFHGFFPVEIMVLARLSRKAVDDALSQAKLETKTHVSGAGVVKPGSHPTLHVLPSHEFAARANPSVDGFMRRMLELIFAAKDGGCLSIPALETRYEDPGGAPIDCWLLSHIVSCPRCLDAASTKLGLPPRGTRPLDDILGQAPKAESRTPKKQAAPVSAAMRSLRAAKERYREVLEHRPRSLVLIVNGERVASRDVNSTVNELSVDLRANDRPEVIEVLSERAMLLAVPVVALPPEAPPVQHFEAELAGGRRIRLVLNFLPSGIRLSILYEDLLFSEAAAQAGSSLALSYQLLTPTVADANGDATEDERHGWLQRLGAWSRRPLLPWMKFAAAALAVALLAVFVGRMLLRPRPSVVVEQAVEAAAVHGNSNNVEVQRVRVSARRGSFDETLHRDLSHRRTPRHQNPSDLQAAIERRLATASIVWSDPLSAVDFRDWHNNQRNVVDLVAEHDEDRNVRTLTVTSLLLGGPIREASLTVRADNFHAVRRTVTFSDHEQIEIAELDDALLPLSSLGASDSAWFEDVSDATTVAHPIYHALASIHEASPPPTEGELDIAELGVRLALMELKADSQERLSVKRRSSGVSVEGLVATRDRKLEIEQRLRMVAHVKPSIETFAEFDAARIKTEAFPRIVTAQSSESASPLDTLSLVQHLSPADTNSLHAIFLNAASSLRHSALELRDLDSRFQPSALGKQGLDLHSSLVKSYADRVHEAALEESRALLALGEKPAPVERALATTATLEVKPIADIAMRNAQLCFELISRESSSPRTAADILNELSLSVVELQGALGTERRVGTIGSSTQALVPAGTPAQTTNHK